MVNHKLNTKSFSDDYLKSSNYSPKLNQSLIVQYKRNKHEQRPNKRPRGDELGEFC